MNSTEDSKSSMVKKITQKRVVLKPRLDSRISQTHNKLQSLVDLVMWRDVSKSAFVFGIGTFIIIASYYTKDINISFKTVVSYLGLVYLAVIFLFKSIICRGVIGGNDTNQDYVVGEEEAVWLVKMILPYLNEFLLKFRALFYGDPTTTMKLAIMLLVLARFGSTITIWKMAKLGFFGVFSLPKICSSHSTLITAYVATSGYSSTAAPPLHHHSMPMENPNRLSNDEVRTIFISGLPKDVKERELQNLLRWLPRYEASQVNCKGEHPMGFALFTTPPFAIAAKDALQEMVFDEESKSVLHTEMAKKNLFVKRG